MRGVGALVVGCVWFGEGPWEGVQRASKRLLRTAEMGWF